MLVDLIEKKITQSLNAIPNITTIHQLTTRIHKISLEMFFKDGSSHCISHEFSYSYCSIPQTTLKAKRTFLINHGYRSDNPFTSKIEVFADIASILKYRPHDPLPRSKYDKMSNQFSEQPEDFIHFIEYTCRGYGIASPPAPTTDAMWDQRSKEHLYRTISVEENSLPFLLGIRNNAIEGTIDTIKNEQSLCVFNTIFSLFSKAKSDKSLFEKLDQLIQVHILVDYTPANSERVTQPCKLSL